MSSLGKTLNCILNTRLDNFFSANEKIHASQIGFKQKSRTMDHMFVLNTIIKAYKQKRKRVYACFVDFRKAFDTVPRVGLLLKLKRTGCSQLFYSLIKDMYSHVNLAVKTRGKVTNYFKSEIGVCQGDVLSPNLFKIYINDLASTLHTSRSPVTIGNTKIPCLLYADDMVILSESEVGLQEYIDYLSKYCRKWGLTVNDKKTQIACFNSPQNATSNMNIKYNGCNLKQSNEYTLARFSLPMEQ